MLQHFRDALTTGAYLGAWKIVGRLPYPLVRRLFKVGADFASKNPKTTAQLRRNLSRLVPPEALDDELVRDAMRSYARYWLEAFRLPVMVKDESLVPRLHAGVSGKEHLADSYARGKGVVLVLPHSGNWDLAGVFLASEYGRFTTVAERLKPEAVYQAFLEFRSNLGFEVLPHTGGQRRPMEVLEERLRQGGIVCLLGERDLKATGAEVEFFGETTRMPRGAVELAHRTGAALHVAHSWFIGSDAWGHSISERIEVERPQQALERVAKVMEENIRQHPCDWHMLQPLWLGDLDPQRYQRGLHT